MCMCIACDGTCDCAGVSAILCTGECARVYACASATVCANFLAQACESVSACKGVSSKQIDPLRISKPRSFAIWPLIPCMQTVTRL